MDAYAERTVTGASQRPQSLPSFSSSVTAGSSRSASPTSSSSVSISSSADASSFSFSSSNGATASGGSDSAASATGSASSSPLAALRPVKVQPDRYTPGMAAITALKKIDAVRINGCAERDGKLYYVVDVYLQRPESRIPTTVRGSQQQQQQSQSLQWQSQWQERQATRATTTTSTKDFGDRDPDFRLERTFSQFTKLRSKAYRDAQRAHGIMRCDLCDNVVTATLLSANQPKRFMNLMCSRERLSRVLGEFLNEVVEIVVCSRRNTGNRACDGQEQIPQLVLAFFQPEADDDGGLL